MTALYSGNLLDDRNGRPIEGAELWVYNSLGVEATLTDIADQPLTQPLTTDVDGAFEYKAADGVYRHDFWKNSNKIYTDNRVVVGVPAVVDVAVGAFGEVLVANATAADARADLGVNSAAELAASGGSALVGQQAAGSGAAIRNARDKMREIVSDTDYTGGLVDAIAAVRNLGDAAFSGTVRVPNGITQPSAAITLPTSIVKITGDLGGTYWPSGATNIFECNAAGGHVLSRFSGFRTYAGVNVFNIGTAGEIASNEYDNMQHALFTGDAYSFSGAGGVTSCSFTRLIIDSTSGDRGIFSAAGINNDNKVDDVDFLNLTDSAIKFAGTTNGLYLSNIRVEGNGQASKAVYDLTAVSGIRIGTGWYEYHHDILLKLNGTSTGNVTIDGIIDIGAKNGVGFKASTFDVGSNMVVFGTNEWANRTIAPLNCMVYGINENLHLASSNVWEWKTQRGGKVHLRQRNTVTDTTTFDLLTFTRPLSAPDTLANLQTLSGVLTLTFSGLNSASGLPTGRVEKRTVSIVSVGAAFTLAIGTDPAPLNSGGGTVTFTPAEKAGGTALSKTLRVTVNGGFAGQDLINATFEFENNTNLATNAITVTPA